MNWKLAVILLLIFSATTMVATATVRLNVPTLNWYSISERRILDTDLQLQGDPIGNPGGPH